MPRSSLLLLALLAACSPEVGISKQSFDMDSDGYSSEVDCDDAHATINPDAPESCDGKDNNCDGVVDEDATDAPTWYVDADGDGVGAESVTGCVAPEGAVATNGDCDDDRAGVHPGAEEHCDGVDEDCDGRVDEDAVDMQSWYADADGDGYGAGSAQPACEGGAGQVAVAGDCDDAAAERHPGAEEADCADPT
ncbi:MAG TPA: putative metal-binding motif-containing protein, partial [Myxococcota bacterium]|nr:putative metal-binding motif-containing protein [Myxococcota bacterium]